MKSWNWKYLKNLIGIFSDREIRFFNKKNNILDNPYANIYKEFTKVDSDIEEKFKDSFSGKNISLEKAKFAKQMFRHLRSFHEDSSIEIGLHNALCDIEILFTKQLYEFCYNLVNYNLEISQKYQMHELSLQLSKWKRKCISRMDKTKLIKKQLKEINELEANCYFQINTVFQLKRVQQEILQIINKKGTSFDQEDKKKSLHLLNELKFDPNKKISLIASALFNEINSWIAYYVHNDKLKALEHNSINYKLFKANKHLIDVYPQLFLSVYSSYYKRATLNNKNDTYKILNEIKNLQFSKKNNIPEDVRTQAFMFTSEVEILNSIHLKAFQNTIAIFKENKKYASKNFSQLKKSYLIIQYYCTGLAHFHLKEYSTALNYTKKNIDNFNDSIRLDFYMYNLTLNFLLHIELDNIYIYKHLNASYKRAIKKHNLQNAEEGIYALFFDRVVKYTHLDKEVYLNTYNALTSQKDSRNTGVYNLYIEEWFLDKYNNFKTN